MSSPATVTVVTVGAFIALCASYKLSCKAFEPQPHLFAVQARKPRPAVESGQISPRWEPVVFSVYSTRYEGKPMKNGKPYRQNRLTCASNRHPIGSLILVRTKRASFSVRVTDRLDAELGKTRIDLSGAAMKLIDPGYMGTDRTAGLVRGEVSEL